MACIHVADITDGPRSAALGCVAYQERGLAAVLNNEPSRSYRPSETPEIGPSSIATTIDACAAIPVFGKPTIVFRLERARRACRFGGGHSLGRQSLDHLKPRDDVAGTKFWPAIFHALRERLCRASGRIPRPEFGSCTSTLVRDLAGALRFFNEGARM